MPLPPSFTRAFRNPPADYRPQPFLVLNGDVTEARLTAMLEQFADRGCGGVFIHPRPGLITEYLSDRWFELWGHALREARRLGLQCHLYDENSFPSGFAGGHVMSQNPLLHGHTLNLSIVTDPRLLPTRGAFKPLAAFAWDGQSGHPHPAPPDAWQNASPENPVACLVLQPVEPSLWHAGFAHPDLAAAGAGRTFLDSTHERYFQRFPKSFGKQLRYCFADEPTLLFNQGLHCSPAILEVFRRQHGYELPPRMAAFLASGEEHYAVRFDYQLTLQRLWIGNFLKPIHDWCAGHGVHFTGHFNEHHWPSAHGNPNNMATQRWMQAPGTDLLAFQFNAASRIKNRLFLLNQKEVWSVACQLGRDRVLCETTGGGGYDMAPTDIKKLTDWAQAHGVNLVNHHLAHQTLAGTRKYDWPHTFSDHSPWWEAFRSQVDHDARVTTALLQGLPAHRVLVLQPTGSAWMRELPKPFVLGRLDLPEVRWMDDYRGNQLHLLQTLADSQIDFDLGDEWIMEEFGRLDNGRLAIGRAAYDLVVVPAFFDNALPSTLRLLEDFAGAGGTILTLGPAPRFLNGRPDPAGTVCFENLGAARQTCADAESCAALIRRLLPPRVAQADGTPLPPETVWTSRSLSDGGSIHFFCHPWNGPATLDTTVRLPSGSLFELDTASGSIRPLPARSEAGGLVFDLSLRPGGHLLVAHRPGITKRRNLNATRAPLSFNPVPLQPAGIRRAENNVMSLDYADLTVRGLRHPGLNTTAADHRLWTTLGFPHNLWNHTIQFKRLLIDIPIPPDSAFQVDYPFVIDPSWADSSADGLPWALAIERPHLYEISVNGRPLDPEAGQPWWDEEMRRFDIRSAIRPGHNVVTLRRSVFHPLCEIMPVWLLGGFSLHAAERGFVAAPPVSPALGDWTSQGSPFYPWGLIYSYTCELTQPSPLHLRLPAWQGSAVLVRLDRHPVRSILWAGQDAVWPEPVEAGPHRLEIEVRGNLKNLLGPHFCDGLPGLWSWMTHPASPPPGSVYRFYPTGLTSEPVLAAGPFPANRTTGSSSPGAKRQAGPADRSGTVLGG